MKTYPLAVAGHLAITCDLIRLGDLEGALAALSRARTLAGDRAAAGREAALPEGEPRRPGSKPASA